MSETKGTDGGADGVVARAAVRYARALELAASWREQGGRMVRDVWVTWAREQEDVAEHPSWVKSWDELSPRDQEVDRRIAAELYVPAWTAGRAEGDARAYRLEAALAMWRHAHDHGPGSPRSSCPQCSALDAVLVPAGSQ